MLGAPDPSTHLSAHFTIAEAFPAKCDRADLSVPFPAALASARFLAVGVLEVYRAALASPLGVNSWARDRGFNASLATDPAAAARVASRPGPHTDGSAADVRIYTADKLPEDERNVAYLSAFALLYRLTLGLEGFAGGLPVNEAILEYAKVNAHITHIHIQAREVGAKRRFVARKWRPNAAGVLCESYESWVPFLGA